MNDYGMDVVGGPTISVKDAEGMIAKGWKFEKGGWWKLDETHHLVCRAGGHVWLDDLAAVQGAQQ